MGSFKVSGPGTYKAFKTIIGHVSVIFTTPVMTPRCHHGSVFGTCDYCPAKKNPPSPPSHAHKRLERGLHGPLRPEQTTVPPAPQPQLPTPLSRTWALPAPRRQRPVAPGPGKAKSACSLTRSNVPPTDLGSCSDQGLDVTSHMAGTDWSRPVDSV